MFEEKNLKRKKSRLLKIGLIIGSVILLISLCCIGGLISREDSNDKDSIVEKESVGSDEVNDEKSEVKARNYEIIYELSDVRYDEGKTYYVLVDTIDLGNDDFKEIIKSIIDDIVGKKGGKISVELFTDKEALDLVYNSHYGNNTLGETLTEEEMDKTGKSYIAMFDGQLEMGMYLNTLSFFPATFVDNPEVGKYIETIEYVPNK